MMTLRAFLGGIAKLDYFWELYLNLRFRYRIGIFLGVANSQLFWGMSDTSDTFFGVGECLVQVYVARKIRSTTPPPPTRGHKKTPSLPPLIQGRLPHDGPWFCVSVMNLLYSEA